MNTTQVYKTGVTHYFSIERAKRDFGYNPEPKTLDGVVKWFKERGHGRAPKETGGTAKKSRLQTLLVNGLLAVVIFTLLVSFYQSMRLY